MTSTKGSADYQTTIRVNASPEELFEALTTTIGLSAWWTPVTGSGETGGELRFIISAPEPLVIHVDEANRASSVRWTVTDCPFLPDWIGTRPTFTITPIASGTAELHFHHQGLNQELECIDICTRSWNHYMSSLRDYLEVGHGSPFGSPNDQARREAQAQLEPLTASKTARATTEPQPQLATPNASNIRHATTQPEPQLATPNAPNTPQPSIEPHPQLAAPNPAKTPYATTEPHPQLATPNASNTSHAPASAELTPLSIHQETQVAASPEQVFELLTTSHLFSAATGQPAELTNREGDAFSLFGGRIQGRQIELVPGQRVVQAWRFGANHPSPWEPGLYSTVRFTLQQTGDSTHLVIDHTGIPSEWIEHISGGYPNFYGDPIKNFFAN